MTVKATMRCTQVMHTHGGYSTVVLTDVTGVGKGTLAGGTVHLDLEDTSEFVMGSDYNVTVSPKAARPASRRKVRQV